MSQIELISVAIGSLIAFVGCKIISSLFRFFRKKLNPNDLYS
jgi:hypothetical protein